MKRREFVKGAGMLSAGLAAGGTWAGETNTAGMKIATFVCDATPPLGDILIWTVEAREVVTPLLLKGVVLEFDGKRHVMAALDWCLVCNDSWQFFRQALAKGAKTDMESVTMQCVHQHTAPVLDDGAIKILQAGTPGTPYLSDKFRTDLYSRLEKSVNEAVTRLEPFNRIGSGAAIVERVASDRRMVGSNGKIMVRYSSGAKNPVMAELAEGNIDPFLKVISFAQDEKVLARLHYYATHPQTHSCDGTIDADFVGHAREKLQAEEGVFHIYFTGCAGDQTVGKYNDTTPEKRKELEERLLSGMRSAITNTKYEDVTQPVWRYTTMDLKIRHDQEYLDICRKNLENDQPGNCIYYGAMRLSSAQRATQLVEFSSLQIGGIHILHLPGEPMLAFQRYAQTAASGKCVAVAGYGDCGTAYIVTEQSRAEGGYEPAASNLEPGSEKQMHQAIRTLLGV